MSVCPETCSTADSPTSTPASLSNLVCIASYSEWRLSFLIRCGNDCWAFSTISSGPSYSRRQYASMLFYYYCRQLHLSGRLPIVNETPFFSAPLSLGLCIGRQCDTFLCLQLRPTCLVFVNFKFFLYDSWGFGICLGLRSCGWKVRALSSLPKSYLGQICLRWPGYTAERKWCEMLRPPTACTGWKSVHLDYSS